MSGAGQRRPDTQNYYRLAGINTAILQYVAALSSYGYLDPKPQ